MNSIQFLVNIGYSLEDLARELHVSLSTVENWNKGGNIDIQSLGAIGNCLEYRNLPSSKEITDDNNRYSLELRYSGCTHTIICLAISQVTYVLSKIASDFIGKVYVESLDKKVEYCHTLSEGNTVHFIEEDEEHCGIVKWLEKDIGIVVSCSKLNNAMLGINFQSVVLPVER